MKWSIYNTEEHFDNTIGGMASGPIASDVSKFIKKYYKHLLQWY